MQANIKTGTDVLVVQPNSEILPGKIIRRLPGEDTKCSVYLFTEDGPKIVKAEYDENGKKLNTFHFPSGFASQAAGR